ncbi:MAG: class I SAM-dependent methyltransferase [Alphaproteobacteria bacterium]|nr:class I SAM-dependent methyltransferase [Alphaproteobacteria bacterium]
MPYYSLPEAQLEAINKVEGFTTNEDYNALSVVDTLRYMAVMYVEAIASRLDISSARLCDCGGGFGWLAFAFLLRGGQHATIVEPHAGKLQAAREIAKILQLADRCTFIDQELQSLDLEDRSVDVFACVETLEHVGKANIIPAVKNIERITKCLIVLTAPNQLSPLVAHDAKVPFSHWLPIGWRKTFCHLFGVKYEAFNHFPGPWHLRPFRERFKPETRVLVFDTYKEWVNHYPVYSPYGGGVWKDCPPKWLGWYLWWLSKCFGKRSYVVCPNLACVWVAKEQKA